MVGTSWEMGLCVLGADGLEDRVALWFACQVKVRFVRGGSGGGDGDIVSVINGWIFRLVLQCC